jgi:hypothetical protein
MRAITSSTSGPTAIFRTNVGEDTCTIYDFNPAETDPQQATKVFARVHTSYVDLIDGLYFDSDRQLPVRRTARSL